MTPERYRQIGELYHAALNVKTEERAAFLERACEGDEELRREVESLVESHERSGNFIAEPALAGAARMLADSKATELIGQTIARYRVVSLIGAGGMGRVYLAEDTGLGRRVALKLLPEHFTNDKNQVQRFRQEARAASALNHPNILTVHEVGQVDGVEFIATEYVEGETLRARLARAPFAVREALDIATQIADALVAAHRTGIVHRDVKPENVMIRSDGYVKVLDFGLAKLTENVTGTRPAELDAPTAIRTNPGVVMGTAEYMSPEQARGIQVDARTDVWSLGVVIYEMVAGRRPFEEATHGDTVVSILEREPVPLLRHAPQSPPELERIVSKALAKDTDERYQTIKDMAIDLKRLKQRLEIEAEIKRSGQPTSGGDAASDMGRGGQKAAAETDTRAARVSAVEEARTTSSVEYVVGEIKRHKQWAALVGAGLILLLGSIGYGLYITLRQPKPPLRLFQAVKVTRLTATGKAKVAAISPDGKYVVYAEEDNQQQSLWLLNIATGSTVQILPPAEYKTLGGVTFSPDGNYIYYLADSTLFQLPDLGGTPLKVSQNVSNSYSAHAVTFSPDGRQIAFKRVFPENNESAIVIADADGAGERILASIKRPRSLGAAPAWSPDGKVIAASSLTEAGNQEVIIVRVADGTSVALPSRRFQYVGQVAWLPDGSGLFVIAQGGSAFKQVWQISYPGGEARNLTNDTNNYDTISLTAEGRALTAVRLEQHAHIWVMPSDATVQAKQLTDGFDKFDGTDGIDWLPDGKIIFFARPKGWDETWVVNADGTNAKQLTKDVGIFHSSPDGRHFVAQSSDAEGIGLWRINVSDGSEQRLTRGTDLWGNYSPDGNWVVYTRYAENVGLWKVQAAGGEAVRLTNLSGAAVAPAVSPDNKLIAFCWWKSRRGYPPSEIALVPFNGGEVIKTFNVSIDYSDGYGKEALQWTPDGQFISFIASRDGVSNIWRQPVDGKPPTQVTNFQTGRVFNFAYSPDGKQLALSRGKFNRDVVMISDFK